ncbi:PAS domain S-box protein [Dictyobacter kobayashii]|nr:PAS domain S-box protein [Dictyobacter kobayashii]
MVKSYQNKQMRTYTAPPQQIEEQLLTELIEMSHDAMIICDSQQHIQSWNHSAERLYGWTSQEAMGRIYHELLQTRPSEGDQDSLFRLLKEDHWEGELVQTSRNGTSIIIKSSQTILKNQKGHPMHILIANQDITDKKQMEQRLQDQFLLTAKAKEIGFWAWDIANVQSTIETQILAALNNMAQEEQSLYLADQIANQHAIQRALQTGENYFDEYVFVDKNQREHWIEVQGRAVYDEHKKPTRMIGMAIDVSRQRQKENQLNESNHRLHTILESLRDAFFLLDHNWCFNYVNQQAATFIHQPMEELLGQNIWEAVPALKGTIFEEKAYEAVRSRHSIQFGAIFEPTQHWYDVHLHPIPEGLSVTYNDVTPYKRTEIALRASEHKFKTLIDANIMGFTLADLDGKIYEANDELLKMLDYTREDLANGKLNWQDFTPMDYKEIDRQAVEDLLNTGVFTPVEKEYYNKHGQRVPVLMAGVMVNNERPLCAAIIVDLTSQKELEKQKETFMSIVGHELRTPLTAINGSMQLAQRRIQRFLHNRPETLPPDVEIMINKLGKLLEQSLRQTRVQNRLINDMLDASRLAIDKLELAMQPCDLINVVKETVEDIRYAEGNHPIYLILPEQTQLQVTADSDRISQVVANYITNALKYSNPDTPVTIEVTKDENEARVWVQDQGQGLSEEAQKHIWDRYYRAANAKDKKGHGVNLGLGLHICQILIQRHNGQVGVISQENKGSSFWFSLPLKQPDTLEVAPVSTHPGLQR